MIGPAALFAVAAVAIALALQISSGMYDRWALAVVSVAAAVAVVGAVWRKRRPGVGGLRLAEAVLGAGCAAGLICTLFATPTFHADPRAFQGAFRGLVLTALAVLSAYLYLHLRASLIRARFLILLACFAAMAVVVIRASPKPWIDVWEHQQAAADALLRGKNPYSISYRDLYGPRARWVPQQMMQGGRVIGFPYPPLTVLADAPGFAVFGDVRYSLLALALGAAWLMARAVPGTAGELAALLVLFQPRTFLVLEQAWTEPLVLFCFALCAYCIARGYWALGGVALGLLAASKQYTPFLLVPLAVLLPRRALLVAAGAFALSVVPFAVTDPRGLWRGMVQYHVLSAFRTDSLSLAAFAVRVLGAGVVQFAHLGLLLGAGVLAVCVRPRLGLAMASAAAAASWAAVLIWYKQSFCNYWWLCAGLLALAAAFPDREEQGNRLATAGAAG